MSGPILFSAVSFRAIWAVTCLMLNGGAALAADAPRAIVVTQAWVRASLGQTPTTAAYLKIENRGAAEDRILSGATPAAAAAQLHESVSTDGIMRMQAVKSLGINPGQSLELAPGGLHIMIMGLKSPLKAGQTIPIKLRLERAGEIEVEAEVRGLGAAK